jgi:putative ATPase
MILLKRVINNKTFVLIQNSLIEEKVTAIVNPANEKLAHGGGVAGLISRQGGADIQRESNEKAPLHTGEATFTTAGTLPFEYVIHTVGPVWRGGCQGEENLLISAVLSALAVADSLGIASVSMPAISTGIFGYPLEPAIKAIGTAIFEYMKKDSSLTEIHLCEFSPDKARQIKEILEKNLPG